MVTSHLSLKLIQIGHKAPPFPHPPDKFQDWSGDATEIFQDIFSRYLCYRTILLDNKIIDNNLKQAMFCLKAYLFLAKIAYFISEWIGLQKNFLCYFQNKYKY